MIRQLSECIPASPRDLFIRDGFKSLRNHFLRICGMVSLASLKFCCSEVSQSAQTQIPFKQWLHPLFDHTYFIQTRHLPCNSMACIPTNPPSTVLEFGNLPFSSSIAANHHPLQIQQAQQLNFSVPAWARLVLNGETYGSDPFESTIIGMKNIVLNGTDVDYFCGTHAYLEALDNEDAFNRAPKLSQTVARTIRSIKPTESGTTFTQYAMIHWFWALWRWMLKPTKNTYRDIPAFARPTSSQQFVSHPCVYDFILPQRLRDLVCFSDTPDIRWFTEAGKTITCHWHGDVTAALCKDGETNEIDLNPIARVSISCLKIASSKTLTWIQLHISTEQNWSLGPSVRPLLTDVDSFISIR